MVLPPAFCTALWSDRAGKVAHTGRVSTLGGVTQRLERGDDHALRCQVVLRSNNFCSSDRPPMRPGGRESTSRAQQRTAPSLPRPQTAPQFLTVVYRKGPAPHTIGATAGEGKRTAVAAQLGTELNLTAYNSSRDCRRHETPYRVTARQASADQSAPPHKTEAWARIVACHHDEELKQLILKSGSGQRPCSERRLHSFVVGRRQRRTQQDAELNRSSSSSMAVASMNPVFSPPHGSQLYPQHP